MNFLNEPVGSASLRFCGFNGVFVCQDVTPLQIVYPDTALRLQALLDFDEEGGEKRVAGDEWLFEGPGTWSLSNPSSS